MLPAWTSSLGSPKFPVFVTGFHAGKLSPSLELCVAVGKRVGKM